MPVYLIKRYACRLVSQCSFFARWNAHKAGQKVIHASILAEVFSTGPDGQKRLCKNEHNIKI